MRIILIILCLLLGGIIYVQLMYYPQINVEVDAIKDPVQGVNLELNLLHVDKPLAAYKEIVSRPLFSIDRRPPAIQGTQVVESIDIGELENLVLFGVVISGNTKYAIVNNRKEDTTEQIKEGHRYKGWRVNAISSDSIQFVGEDAQYELFISPNDTTKKSGLRNTPKKTSLKPSIFRSVNQKRKSPIRVPEPPPSAQEEIDQELLRELDELGEEGGFEYDLDEQFDEDELNE